MPDPIPEGAIFAVVPVVFGRLLLRQQDLGIDLPDIYVLGPEVVFHELTEVFGEGIHVLLDFGLLALVMFGIQLWLGFCRDRDFLRAFRLRVESGFRNRFGIPFRWSN